MHGLDGGVHHTQVIARVGADGDASREEGARIEAARAVETEEAVVVDVADVEADLVHVAREHDARGFGPASARAAGITPAEQRAHGVGFDVIEEPLDLLLDEFADTLLSARNAGSLAEPLEEIDVH